MIIELVKAAKPDHDTDYTQRVSGKYEVGEKVIWKALQRNGHNYFPDEMIEGTVIAAFENGPRFTYRIELERVWVECSDCLKGRKIVVGNITANQIYIRVD